MKINIGDVFVKHIKRPSGNYEALKYTVTVINQVYDMNSKPIDVITYVDEFNKTHTQKLNIFIPFLKKFNVKKSTTDETIIDIKTYIKRHRFNY